MTKHRKKLIVAAVGVAILLAFGYVRLPFAALRQSSDYKAIKLAPVIYMDTPRMDISSIQALWIKSRLRNLKEGPATPKINVNVQWYALLLARVRSGNYFGSEGAGGRDSLYLWFFGFWIEIYNYSSWIS